MTIFTFLILFSIDVGPAFHFRVSHLSSFTPTILSHWDTFQPHKTTNRSSLPTWVTGKVLAQLYLTNLSGTHFPLTILHWQASRRFNAVTVVSCSLVLLGLLLRIQLAVSGMCD